MPATKAPPRAVDPRKILGEAAARYESKSKCLWPPEFSADTPESAIQFNLGLCTWNESEGEVQAMPELDYLKFLTYEWFGAKERGGTLTVSKCRRMVVSWWLRGLELHQMGLSRQDWLLGGEKYSPACKHVWRLKHLYEDLARREPDYGLPPAKFLSFEGERALKQFSLTNGSVCNAVNGEGNNVQGEGLKGVVFEEASLYPHLESMVGQAKIITQARPGKTGGFIVLVANPEHNYQWLQFNAGGE